MRIAMVSEHASPLAVLGGSDAGGQNVYVAALAQELGRRGHDVVVHTRRQDPTVARRLHFAPRVHVEHVDAGPARVIPKDDIWPFIDDFADDLLRSWEQERPDVVHAHFWMSGIAALRAARQIDVPVVQTFHALGVVKRRHLGQADPSPADRLTAEQELIDAADHIIATCSDEAFELRQLGARMERVSIVPCGVNVDAFTPDGPELDRDPRFRHRLAVVNRLVPRKGVDDVIRALVDLPDTELLVAGGPARDALDGDPEVARLRAIAEDLGVADRVTLLGGLERRDVPPLLRSSDALVAVPWYEPFGIVPLEAMATGVPVVAAAVGGMIDTVTDGVTGLHVPPRDPAALGRALRRLFDDETLRARLARSGPARVRARYSWSQVAASVLGAYGRTLRRRRVDAATSVPPHVASLPTPTEHVHALVDALGRLRPELGIIERWGVDLASRLVGGARLLACGNGGSAADAQHLTAELVGRYRDERRPLSAIALHAETSSVTAIANDYGYDEVFARQVRAHARPGDVLLAFSTSGTSASVVRAADAAQQAGCTVWAMTGPGPNELASIADEVVCVEAASTATIQEVHGVLVHALCAAVDRAILGADAHEGPASEHAIVLPEAAVLGGARTWRVTS